MGRIQDIDGEIKRVNAEIGMARQGRGPTTPCRGWPNMLIVAAVMLLLASALFLTYSRITGLQVLGNESMNATDVTLQNQTQNQTDGQQSFDMTEEPASGNITGAAPEQDSVPAEMPPVLIRDSRGGEPLFISDVAADPDSPEELQVTVATTMKAVKKIKLQGVKRRETIDIYLEELPEGNWKQHYAIDLSSIEFTGGEMTVTAQGDMLFKCREWNFSTQECHGNWTKVMDLKPGEEYTIQLSPEDPGFGELSLNTYYMFETTDPQYPTYRQMLNQTVGGTTYTSTRLDLSTAGAFCWPEMWIAPAWIERTAVNGTWNFSVYGYCNHEQAEAYLFARMAKVNSSGAYNFQNTTQSATDLCTGGTTTNTISYTLPYSHGADLLPGERIAVDFCLNITAYKNSKYAVIEVEGGTPSNVLLPNASWDETPPAVTLISPPDGESVASTTVEFRYNVSDVNAVANCTLILDSAANQTDTTVTRDTEQTIIADIGSGSHNWSIRCTDIANNTGAGATRAITVIMPSETVPPTWSNNRTHPTTPATYSPAQQYQFNVTWTDNANFSEARIEHNFTGTPENHTVTANNGDEYYYDYPALAAGEYCWKEYGTDNSSNRNTTDTWHYTVDRAASSAELLLNGTAANFTILQGQYANMTGIRTSGHGSIYLYRNSVLINSGTTQVTNISQFLAAGQYNITVLQDETRNYTASSMTRYVTVQPDNIPPYVTSVSVYPSLVGMGLRANISARVTDNAAVANVTARVTYPDASVLDYPMAPQSDSNYTHTLKTTFTMPLGQYNITIIAHDYAGNANDTEKTNFTTYDAPPFFEHYGAVPDPVAVNQTIRIYANITDNSSDVAMIYVNGTNYTAEWNVTTLQTIINITNSAGNCTFAWGSTAQQANVSDDYRSLISQGMTCGWNLEDMNPARFAGFNNITAYVEHVAETGVTALSSTLYAGNTTSDSAYGSRTLSTFEGTANQLENVQGTAVTGEGADSHTLSALPKSISEFNDLRILISNNDAGGEDQRGVDHIYLLVTYKVYNEILYADIDTTGFPMGWNNYTIYTNDTLQQWSSVNGTFRVDYAIPPAAMITSPSGGSSFMQGDDINFTGYATDLEDGNLTGKSLVWTSSIDGRMGTGSELLFATLTPGNHTITLTATDSFGLKANDSVQIEVKAYSCPGMEANKFTLVNITIDGDMTDWDPVLQDTDNQITDGVVGVNDPDVTKTADKDLRKYAVTWNDEWLWMYVRRSSGGKTLMGIDTYFDFDQDSLLKSTDRVLVTDWSGSNRLYDTALYNYSPANISGDPVLGDGFDQPGTVTDPVQLETKVLGGSEEGIELEWRARWSDLGVDACTPIISHISSTLGAGTNIPSQIEDNMASFDSRIYGLKLYFDSTKSGRQGTTVTHQHTLRNVGNLPDLFNLELTGTLPGYSITAYYANGTQLTDTDSDGRIDTGYILPSYGHTIYVDVAIPSYAASGEIDTTTITAHSKLSNTTSSHVIEITIVGAISVIPNNNGYAVENSTVTYYHIIYNNDISSTVNVNYSSSQGYAVTLHYINGTQLTDTNGDTLPDIGVVYGGWFKPLIAKVYVPSGAATGTADNTTITASSLYGESGRAYDVTTVSRALSITPNITRAAGQGTSIYLLHDITYVSSVPGVVDITYNRTQNFTLQFYKDDYTTPLTDTDGDGIIDAGWFLPNGHTKKIAVKMSIPINAVINTTETVYYNVTSNTTNAYGSAADNVSVQKLVTYKDPAFNIQSYQFMQTEKVYAQAYALDMANVYFRYIDPNMTVMRISPFISVDALMTADDMYLTSASDLSGEWTLILYNKQGSAEITRIHFWLNTPPVVLSANYTPADIYEGDTVNFSSSITAGETRWFPNETVVMGALLEIAGKNYSFGGPGTMTGIGIYNLSLDTYNITPGTYTYKVWAYDNFTFYNVSIPWTGQITIKPYNFTNVSGYITNTTYGIVPSTLQVRNSTGHIVWTDDETYSFKLYRGDKYDVTILPATGSIKEITYINVTFQTIMVNFTRLEDSPEGDTDKPDEIKSWTEAITWWTSPQFYYAQARINFTYGAGNDLYFWKCSDWNFDNRTCNNNNFQVIQNLTDGPGWAVIYLAPGDPGAGAGKAPDYNESVKVWDVTGLNETERRYNGTFVGEFYDLQSINFTIGKSYRIEVFVTQTVPEAVGILRDPYYDNIPDDWAIDTNGTDHPNITQVNGSVVIDPFVATIVTGTEPNTQKLIWDSAPPNKTVSDIDVNETVKLWFVFDLPINASNQTHTGHFLGKSKGHDAETTNNLTILTGQPPCKVNLTFPNNGNNTLINRTLTFMWEEACDPDNQTLTYSINITSQYCADIYDTNIAATNYTPIYELGTYDECGTYNWTVRAYDGIYYGNWSDSWNFSIMPYVALFLVSDTIDFGQADNGCTNDTADDNPPPFVIQSDGNVFTDIINATANQSMFTGASATDSDFQVKAGNTTELWSFNWTGSAFDWINLTTIQKIIDRLDWHDLNDSAEIDIKVHVPIDESPGVKVTGLVFYGEQP